MKNNRKIKFRIWNGKSKEMIYPSESFKWTISLDGEIFRDLGTSIKDKEKCTLLQFTGLLDINNKEIFEGDIIKINFGNKSIGQVIYHPCSFIIANKRGVAFQDTYYCLTTGEIIGNICENPELLK